MRFRYAFQKIVDLKSTEKTQAEWIFSQAIGKLREEEQSLTELHRAKQEVQEQLLDMSQGKTTISEMKLMQGFVDHLDGRIHNKSLDVKKAKINVEMKQTELNGKAMEEKVWNKARERALHTFQAEALKREQDQLDEMATNRYLRHS